jgi:DnaJ-class molecular chaperone
VCATGRAPIRDTPHPLPAMSVVRRRIVGMRTLEICERCDGTGADPFQHDDEVTMCVECGGDGCHVTYLAELQQTA